MHARTSTARMFVANGVNSCVNLYLGNVVDAVETGRAHISEEVKDYARKINARVFATSAKTGAGIEELFQDIAENHVRQGGAASPEGPAGAKNLQSMGYDQPKEKKKCEC